MAIIVNLTQHGSTEDQRAAGVIDLVQSDQMRVSELLTFTEIPSVEAIRERAIEIADIAARYSPDAAMIGGAPWIISPLAVQLTALGISPLAAFSRRVSVEEKLPDGSVRKSSIFRHEGFVPL